MRAIEGEYKSHKKEYLIIFAVLTVLTALELAVPSLSNTSNFVKGVLLTAMAIGKAFVVGYYYMHLNEERPCLKFIAVIPLSAAIYTLVVALEAIAR